MSNANRQTPAGPDTNSGAEPTLYQMILSTYISPVRSLWIVAVMGGCVLALLGYPVVAALWIAASYASEFFFQSLFRRWRQSVADADQARALTKLGAVALARGVVSLSGSLYVVVVGHGAAELAVFLVSVASALSITIVQTAFSGRVFRIAIFAPLGVLLIGLAARFANPHGAAVFLSAALLALVLWAIGVAADRASAGWVAAGEEKNNLIHRLEVARDQAERANRAKSTFLATMSHEIRTPMNGVLGMAQILKRSSLTADQEQQIDTLIHSGEFLLSILNDILDVSKIDAGRMEVAPSPADLRTLLTQLTQFWTPHAAEKGLTLTLTVAEATPRFVEMDALRVRQILFNLIGNALKFTEQGGVTIAVEAEPAPGDRPVVNFAITDTGVGIAADAVGGLFERFTQVDESAERRFGGTGLGLAISKQLTDLMGGRIWVESTPGRGSTFHVALPLAIAEAPAEPAPAPSEPETATEETSLSILAVDDNPVNLNVLDHLLRAVGHQVTTASGGTEALEALAARAFDLVLMDIQMPGMSGPQVVERLRQLAGPNQTTPMIALTADAVSGGHDRYLALGFCDYVTKPIEAAVLLAAIARAVSDGDEAALDVA